MIVLETDEQVYQFYLNNDREAAMKKYAWSIGQSLDKIIKKFISK